MVMVMVGATIVGAIGTSWHGDVKRSKKLERFDYSEQFSDKIISQGSEMGYFKLGSTVVLLFANGEKIQWDKELLAGSKIQLGKPMAIIT
ncbi:phosphatidylserine decarboxylase [Legionella pneumophila]|nr:phosphatidylserine decarboxylase [Legionella pneumophila]